MIAWIRYVAALAWVVTGSLVFLSNFVPAGTLENHQYIVLHLEFPLWGIAYTVARWVDDRA